MPWWGQADTALAKGFDELSVVSELIAARIVRHPKNDKEALLERGAREPLLGQGGDVLYEAMGARDPAAIYVAVWLNMDDASLVFLCRVTDRERFERCVAGDFMKERAKLIISPVALTLPFPSKGPRDADTVGQFFKGSYSSTRCATPRGAAVECVRIDFFSIWWLRLAIKKAGFQLGNVLDLFIVDYDSRAVVGGCRLTVTEEFTKQLAGV